MSEKLHQSFLEFLDFGNDRGGFETDDVLSAVLPLMEQVLGRHDEGLVAPLRGLNALRVSHGVVWFQEAEAFAPIINLDALSGFGKKDESRAMQVVDREDLTMDLDEANYSSQNLRVWSEEAPPSVPVFIVGYETWEHRIGCHDALTDVFSLGLLLASLASGLNFSDAKSVELFADGRDFLHRLCERLHPVVASTIVRMTELRREDRAQDLRTLIGVLRNYRDQPKAEAVDFSKEEGFLNSSKGDRRRLINEHLRDRLFDISKRNRLLYFRQTMQSVNLTVSSVPLLLDYKNVRSEQLFIWQKRLADALANEEPIALDRYLRFEDAPYLAHSLDSIRREANRERKEYGFSELRFVLAFFRWHNLKEEKDRRIHTPLLLHPVELVKKKGVRDTWHLEPAGSIAEVNPALRYHLKQLYDLDLPEALDLRETSLEAFYDILQKQIKASEPAVELKKIEKPQIDLVVEKARRRLDRFLQRRRVSGRSVKSYDNIDYSYRRSAFQPLGLQLFLKKIKPSVLPLEHLLSEKPVLRSPGIKGEGRTEAEISKEVVKKRETYRLREGSEENPYSWDFDLCSLTLANFSYRKMSLVRDYNTLLQEDRVNSVFDEVFSLTPRESLDEGIPEIPLDDQYLIVPADPTQVSSIAAARTGKNLIIQGPPGTGKSQTITNLIADFTAKGKKVLFVCEKRAALDVVYQRLAASGLDRLACLIHDSQTDKKSFIQDLKETYETFVKSKKSQGLEKKATQKSLSVSKELETLKHFGDAMSNPLERISSSLRYLLDRLVLLRGHEPEMSEAEEEQLPDYKEWLQFSDPIKRLAHILEGLNIGGSFAETPFAVLKRDAFSASNPVSTLKSQIEEGREILSTLSAKLEVFSFDTETCSLEELRNLSFIAESARYLARFNLLSLLDEESRDSENLEKYARRRKVQAARVSELRDNTTHWMRKLEPRDTDSALAQALGFQNSIVRFINPSFWKLRKVLRQSYDFSKHAITPDWVGILSDLQKEHQEQSKLDQIESDARSEFGADNMDELTQRVEGFKARRMAVSVDSEDDEAFYQGLLKNDDQAKSTVESLAGMHEELQSTESFLNKFLLGAESREVPWLMKQLEILDVNLDYLPEILIELQDLSEASEAFHQTLRTKAFSPEVFECACALKNLHEAYREDRSLKKFEGWMLRRHAKRAEADYEDWMDLNGERIVSRVRDRFKKMYAMASKSTAQLSDEEKSLKKNFNSGRRELEHEFGKTMRYKSIRDLATGHSGKVVLSLKPIWLMSPLSISDTIPMEEDQFDVVIFDEASQIRLEEAIPAIQRASQVIVVGDEMQLPPTSFFDTSSSEEEEFVAFEDEGEMVEYDLSSDSFLTHSARTLPSTMLGWHYRSRYESLISFSNTIFYNGGLLTIPDRTASLGRRDKLDILGATDFTDFSNDVLNRSISFHHMNKGVYTKRQNAVEANYIAHLVRSLLLKESGLNMGIVAFSEAQQIKIQEALNQLASEDDDFRRRLELEKEREEDGQHCGLFVKNLENVQGDERDIMLLSICYAPDQSGKMRMNFGPINRSGGEKRLNVIFSRARKHMVIVSSIRHHQITNDYNDGANCLKRFLEYAEAVSIGDQEMASHVLAKRGEQRKVERGVADSVETTLHEALVSRGYVVDKNVGESQFTCDLALRFPGDENYRLGILLDGSEHYAIKSPLERYVLRSGILRVFGWRVFEVLGKDWYHDPDLVLQSIDRLMNTDSAAIDVLAEDAFEAPFEEERS